MDTVTISHRMTYELNVGFGIGNMGKEVGLVVGIMVGYVLGR